MINHKNSILVATHNAGKLKEFLQLLALKNYAVTSLADYGITQDVEETGTTFEENASLKASAYGALSGSITIADDGGLEVDALQGKPGIYSARFAGPHATDEDKIAHILKLLKDIPEEKRTAQFVSVLALHIPGQELQLFRGVLKGSLSFKPQGTPRKGLPYRQIFVPSGFEKTLDQLDDEKISYDGHRQQTLAMLLKFLP